jgi:hypothetical protein
MMDAMVQPTSSSEAATKPRLKGELFKVRLAAKLCAETRVTVGWIAE